MRSFKKLILALIALTLTFNFCLSTKVSQLKLLNLEYTRNGSKVKYPMKYEKLSIEHDLPIESDINSFYFKYVWVFSSEEEKQKGSAMISDIKNDFDVASQDENGVSILFQAKDLTNLKLYKKNEFGSAFVLELEQKGNKVQLQFQIPKDQEHQDDLHDLVVKVLDSKKQVELEQLEQSLQFLQ